MVAERDCIVADRNFCTLGFLFGVARRRRVFCDSPTWRRTWWDSPKARAAESATMPGGKRSMNKPCV